MSAETNPRSGLENAVFGLSLVAVLALVAALAYAAATGPSGPADVRVRVLDSREARVSVEVENRGGTVAEAVRVEVCEVTTIDAEGIEVDGACAEVEVPYVPAGSVRRATVGFEASPRHALGARVVSFLEP